jgi:hypothetical protein
MYTNFALEMLSKKCSLNYSGQLMGPGVYPGFSKNVPFDAGRMLSNFPPPKNA